MTNQLDRIRFTSDDTGRLFITVNGPHVPEALTTFVEAMSKDGGEIVARVNPVAIEEEREDQKAPDDNFDPEDLENAIADAISKLYPDEVPGMSITFVDGNGAPAGSGPRSEPRRLVSKSAGPFTVTATFSFRKPENKPDSINAADSKLNQGEMTTIEFHILLHVLLHDIDVVLAEDKGAEHKLAAIEEIHRNAKARRDEHARNLPTYPMRYGFPERLV